jgi:hypothetical protein
LISFKGSFNNFLDKFAVILGVAQGFAVNDKAQLDPLGGLSDETMVAGIGTPNLENPFKEINFDHLAPSSMIGGPGLGGFQPMSTVNTLMDQREITMTINNNVDLDRLKAALGRELASAVTS